MTGLTIALVGALIGAVTGFFMTRPKSPAVSALIFLVGFIAMVGFLVWFIFTGG